MAITRSGGLKRNGSSESSSPYLKKLKLLLPAEQPYETPLNCLPGSGYQLPSSVGPHESPKDFSPVPALKTSSIGSKENIRAKKTYKSRKKSRQLASPFNSRPNSAESSPKKPIQTRPHFQSRTLSDNTQKNIPIAQSATNSPSSPNKTRPSDLRSAQSSPVFSKLDFLEHPPISVDFNRPPSQLSLYDYNCNVSFNAFLDAINPDQANASSLLADIQATSTPWRAHRHAMSSPDSSPLAIDFNSVIDISPARCITPVHSDDETNHTITGQRSPWISDSLISPPRSMEWNMPPVKPNGRKDDVEMADPQDPPVSEEVLKEIFKTLIIDSSESDSDNTQLPRTHSLDSAAAVQKPKGRERRSTIRPSDFGAASSDHVSNDDPIIQPPRRSRSGTITARDPAVIAPPVVFPSLAGRRTRSGTIVSTAACPLPTLGEDAVPLAPALSISSPVVSRRARSGSILASSVYPGGNVGRPRSGTIFATVHTRSASDGDKQSSETHRDAADITSTPASPRSPDDPLDLFAMKAFTPAPRRRAARPTRNIRSGYAMLHTDGDESDDELNLLQPFHG